MEFYDQLLENLKSNGFPAKKVAFNLETLYEISENKGQSLNDILDKLSSEGIFHTKTDEKIIFYKESQKEPENSNDLFKQAQEMMQNMSQEELEQVKSMAENMSDEERQQMMEQAKKMGLI